MHSASFDTNSIQFSRDNLSLNIMAPSKYTLSAIKSLTSKQILPLDSTQILPLHAFELIMSNIPLGHLLIMFGHSSSLSVYPPSSSTLTPIPPVSSSQYKCCLIIP